MKLNPVKNPRTGNIILEIDGAEIKYPNLEGRADQFNRNGERYVNIIVDEEYVDFLRNDLGINVKERPRNKEGTEFEYSIKAKMRFNGRTTIYLSDTMTSKHIKINEDTANVVDTANIVYADFDLNVREWELGGRSGVNLWIDKANFVQEYDRFAQKFAEQERPTDE